MCSSDLFPSHDIVSNRLYLSEESKLTSKSFRMGLGVTFSLEFTVDGELNPVDTVFDS